MPKPEFEFFDGPLGDDRRPGKKWKNREDCRASGLRPLPYDHHELVCEQCDSKRVYVHVARSKMQRMFSEVEHWHRLILEEMFKDTINTIPSCKKIVTIGRMNMEDIVIGTVKVEMMFNMYAQFVLATCPLVSKLL